MNRQVSNLPINFNWKIVKQIGNNIETEESAIQYFRRFGQPNTEFSNQYFRKAMNIPDIFNEELYIKFLKQEYNVNITTGEIINERLYNFFNSTGHKLYPLDDKYKRMLYNTPVYFDKELYKRIYQNSTTKPFAIDLARYNNIFEFFKYEEMKLNA